MLIVFWLAILANRRAPNGMIRPFINLVQTLTVMLMFRADYPPALMELFAVLKGMSLGVEVASPQCAGLGSGPARPTPHTDPSPG